MKNKFYIIVVLLFFCFTNLEVNGEEQFNFDISEIEIVENGNKFIGKKEGIITTNNGVIIAAKEFEYNKKLNLLEANGNVEIHDKVNNYFIYSEKIFYDKNAELITTDGKSKAISVNDNTVITSKSFEYFKSLNIISAYKNVKIKDENRKYILNSDFAKYLIKDGIIFTNGNSKILNLNNNTKLISENINFNVLENIIIADKNVILENEIKKYKISANKISYFKNEEKILTEGDTSAKINSKYFIKSKNVTLLQNTMELFSKDKTTINDNHNIYSTSNFRYFIEDEFLKGQNILINSNYNKPKSDKYYFANGMLNLKNQEFLAGKTEIEIHKDLLNNPNNDPRIKGISSKKDGNVTYIKKGIFTSCKKNDKCPPWSIQAKEIKHNKDKQEIFYKDAILKVYDFPILYFPKFFHPDPSVKRRSGILTPVINDSNILGSSLTIPYFNVISEDTDYTVTPTIFDSGTNMIQNEYRKVGENSNILINFGHAKDYKSSVQKKNKNISYIFSKIELDLNLPDFNSSLVNLDLEKVTNDTFLKVFDTNLHQITTPLKPVNNSVMRNDFKIILDHENYNLKTGFSAYENLQKNKNDRYQYILPYYDFDKLLNPNFLNGSINFNSSGSNNLNNTNQLLSKITNNLSYSSNDFFTNKGLKNNFNLNFKNLNSVGENVTGYKSKPQIELSSIFEANTSLPLKKETKDNISFLTPKISIRANPGDMKDHSVANNKINIGNIFSVDRFALDDTYESGKSLTIGLDYKNETIDDVNKYFQLKLASVIRDKEEKFIPNKTTLNKKSSNIFGSISTNHINNLNLNYNFALDNNLEEMQYNDINASLNFMNFSTTFNFIKEMGEMGDENFFKNSATYRFDDQNFLKFNTRRNRKISLTEFYDLVYEYKNDCLTAGIKYKKTYYEDKDLKPTEDLLFTITFIPLTTYEQSIDNLK